MAEDWYEQVVLDNIAEHGWAGTVIEPDEEGPGFEYTTGLLAHLDHPEIIVFGLSTNTMHDVLWQMFHDIKAGRDFREEGVYEGVLDRFACRVQVVHPSWHGVYFGYALWHRRQSGVLKPFAAVQCVWPDKQGFFPGEAGCNAQVAERQPDLTKPRPASE